MPDDPQALEVAAEVGRLVAGEELVVEAVVALPLADAARRVRVAGVRAVVVAARDEVVAAVLAEPAEQLPGPAEVDRHGLGGDVAGGEQERRAERARRRRRATRASPPGTAAGRAPAGCPMMRRCRRRARPSSRPCAGRCTARSRRGTDPAAAAGVVKLYGPPVVEPEVGGADRVAADERERRRRHRLPVRPGLVVVGPARLEARELDVVVRRVARSDRRRPGSAAAGRCPSARRRRPAPAPCDRARRRCRCSPCTR